MEYGYNNKMQIQLMSKKDLKRMGHASPDCADALSFTFADAVFDGKPRSRARKVIGVSKYLWV
jgi:Holliday junction resolvasome RuvABC endonuclease subunit